MNPMLLAGFEYLAGFANFEKQTPMREAYRLDRMAALLGRCGDPQLAVPAIHVAGSKGKGSTVHHCAALLHGLGYRVGIYASPHLRDWRERICQPGAYFEDAVYLEQLEAIRSLVADCAADPAWPHGQPTTFELLTLLAFLVFRAQRLDWVVIETGLGGLLDATNLVRPKACAITALELEHCDILGDTIAEIAAQKAGIFKQGALLFALEPTHDARVVREVLEGAAQALGSPLAWVDGGGAPDPNARLARRIVEGLGCNGLLGAWSADDPGFGARLERAQSGLVLEGRLEWYEHPQSGERVLLDVAHTPDSVDRALVCFGPLPGDGLLFGSVSGKRYQEMARRLAPRFDRILISTPGSFKQSDPALVWEAFAALNPRTRLEPDPVRAWAELRTGTAPGQRLLVLGSFYLAGIIQPLLVAAGFRSRNGAAGGL